MLTKTTLEQWSAFVAVVEEGGFAQAAERLNKSQSSVSYLIARLQDHVPAQLFKQSGRKAELTDSGKKMLIHARALLERATEVERTAHYLAEGWEPEVVVAADALVQTCRVLEALEGFAKLHPLIRVRLIETSLSGTEDMLLTRQAHIVITTSVPPGFMGPFYDEATMVTVAHPEHPLIKLNREITDIELKQHRQIVLRDSGIKREKDAGWLGSEQRWTVSHFATSVQAIKMQLGFATLPLHFVEDDLIQGELKLIPLGKGLQRRVPIYIVQSNAHQSGPATQLLFDALREQPARKPKIDLAKDN